MSNLQELISQRDALDQQIAQAQKAARGEAITQVRALMAQFGLTVQDLAAGGQPRAGRGPKAGSTIAAKYRDPATGKAWTGRGLQPRWLRAAIDGGAKLEDFAMAK